MVCDCKDCTRNVHQFSKSGVPTNMSVRNCDFSPYSDCKNKRFFKIQNEPIPKGGYTYINPTAIESSYSTEFQKVNCKDKACNDHVFISTDPRLIDAPRAQLLPLDRPPYNGTVNLKDIYSPKLNGYGEDYRTYSDINAGQIAYYTSKAREDAFYSPLFSTSATTVGTVYKDPMGAMKPQYDRYPITCNDKDKPTGGLSFINDSHAHREDLLARQMRKRNEQRWMPRWS